MERETIGAVLSVSKLWWLKVNKKPLRVGPFDGATFPHVIKISYSVDGNKYTKRKWLCAGHPVPIKGGAVKVIYDESNPSKARIAADCAS